MRRDRAYGHEENADRQQYDTLKTQGLSDREIARQWGIPWTTFHREKQLCTAADRGTPAM